jgi:uncharacterized protein YndB with AHSA1/START domain
MTMRRRIGREHRAEYTTPRANPPSRPPRGYAYFVNIAKPTERVFSAFTSKESLERWYAVEASVEPRSGGRFRVRLKDGRVRDATIDVWEPGRRLRLIYMPETGAKVPQTTAGGPLVEDILFDAKDGNTVVRVLGAGVPDEREWDNYLRWLRSAWGYWLAELKRLLESAAA